MRAFLFRSDAARKAEEKARAFPSGETRRFPQFECTCLRVWVPHSGALLEDPRFETRSRGKLTRRELRGVALLPIKCFDELFKRSSADRSCRPLEGTRWWTEEGTHTKNPGPLLFSVVKKRYIHVGISETDKELALESPHGHAVLGGGGQERQPRDGFRVSRECSSWISQDYKINPQNEAKLPMT